MSLDTTYLSNMRQQSIDYMRKVASKYDNAALITHANGEFCPNAYKIITEITGKEPELCQTVKSIEELIYICSSLNNAIDSFQTKLKNNTYFLTDSSLVYYNLRSAIASNDFAQGEKWMTADLTPKSKSIQAIAQAKPPSEIEVHLNDEGMAEWQKRMYESIIKMDDVTADVFDIITSLWIQRAANSDSRIAISADDFLSMRGIQPKKSGSKRKTESGIVVYRGGYRREQREQIASHIHALDQIWVIVDEMEVTEVTKYKKKRRVKKRIESKAINLTVRASEVSDDNKVANYMWLVRPGDIFAEILLGPGRQTALLSKKALEYDPYRQVVEKRLYRYFVWQWRVRQSNKSYMQPFLIGSLLNEIKHQVDSRNPSFTKERLEKALDTLQEDGLIAHWQYEMENEKLIGKKGWVKEWLSWKILIEPPMEIINQYDKINNQLPIIKAQSSLPQISSPTEFDYKEISAALKKKGLERGLNKALTLTVAAREIGISISRLSRIIQGDVTSEETKEKILKWMSSNN